VRDEEPLVGRECLPVGQVGAQVDLLGRPKARLVLLVELPQPAVADRKEHEAVGVVAADGLDECRRARRGRAPIQSSEQQDWGEQAEHLASLLWLMGDGDQSTTGPQAGIPRFAFAFFLLQ
jgi:hypothetical protein